MALTEKLKELSLVWCDFVNHLNVASIFLLKVAWLQPIQCALKSRSHDSFRSDAILLFTLVNCKQCQNNHLSPFTKYEDRIMFAKLNHW